MSNTPPSLFIGSSAESSRHAGILLRLLAHDFQVTPWWAGLFDAGQSTLEDLVNKAGSFDLAAILMSPDDWTNSRAHGQPSPRDNVVFELGLFIGALGRSRAVWVLDRSSNLKLPSDLRGITAIEYDGRRSDGNDQAALAEAAEHIKEVYFRLGPRKLISTLIPLRPPTDEEASENAKTVWVIGSYGDGKLGVDERLFAGRFVKQFGAQLASAKVSLVAGESDLLNELCAAHRQVGAAQGAPPALTIHGSLRAVDIREAFLSAIGRIPTVAVIIAGGTRGRAAIESIGAANAGMQVIAVSASGGAAANCRATWRISSTEPSDAAREAMTLIMEGSRSLGKPAGNPQ